MNDESTKQKHRYLGEAIEINLLFHNIAVVPLCQCNEYTPIYLLSIFASSQKLLISSHI
jgi:hypothetical protein